MWIGIYHIDLARCKQASLFYKTTRVLYKTSQYFHIKKTNTGYLLCIIAIFKLCSTAEQMPVLVFISWLQRLIFLI
jgi:hypothetical protein